MTFKVFSLGCKVNSYECAALSSQLIREGYVEAGSQTPDVFIINTCSVTATADQKSRQHIRKFMKAYPECIVVVMGCYAQGNYEFVANEIKPAILVGTSHRKEIPDLIKKYIETKERIVLVDENPRKYSYEELGVTSFSENTRAYLKIQDGCDNFCSYCIIPYRRGKMRSRNKEDVIEEAKYLVSQGYQEIVLAGIHVGGYGKDLNTVTFSDLVEELLNIPNLNSLRISSIEESEIDDHLIELLGKKDNLAKHLHIPLQSGSETVLKRMNRKYTKEQFLSKINKIKSIYPDLALTTDVIVGFPGESEEEFLECYEFIKECGFHQLHVFPFSPREGTPAARMDNQIDPRIKSERVNKLMELSKNLWDEYASRFVGKQTTVLVERYSNKNNIGHTSNYIELAIPSNEGKVGQQISVKIQKDMIVSK